MGSVFSKHNKKILFRKEDQYGCSRRNKAECPLDNNCLTPRIIYQTDVLTNLNDSKKFYITLADIAFKEGYRNNTRDFRNQHYEKSTELSKYIWRLKKIEIEYTIHWKDPSHIKGLTKKGFCSLCLTEKLWLIKYLDDVNLPNKKLELISKCRHEIN